MLTWTHETLAVWRAEGSEGTWTIVLDTGHYGRPFQLTHTTRGSCGRFATHAEARFAAARKERTGSV
jgi:hypothetical protein